MTIDLRKIGNQSSAVMLIFINAVACTVSNHNTCRNKPTGRNRRICIMEPNDVVVENCVTFDISISGVIEDYRVEQIDFCFLKEQ